VARGQSQPDRRFASRELAQQDWLEPWGGAILQWTDEKHPDGRMTPALETAAIKALRDRMASRQADAVQALGECGSGNALQPL
jgi:hypothetical protein